MYKAFFPDAEVHYVIGDIFMVDPTNIPPASLVTFRFNQQHRSHRGF